MESNSQRLSWLKIDKFLDKNVNIVNLRGSRAASVLTLCTVFEENLGILYIEYSRLVRPQTSCPQQFHGELIENIHS